MSRLSSRATSLVAGAMLLAGLGFAGSAQALPASVAVAAPHGVEAARYGDADAPRHHMGRHHRYGRYGANAHPRHPGHAGLYDCGPGGHRTRLSRKACGGIDRFGHMNRF